MLHIHSGDWSAKAASSLFGGTHLAWTDNLFEGPLPPADWNDPAWYDARAAALADYLGGRVRAADLLKKQYDIVRNALARTDEVTLWFDSCLYDMMLLCQFLAFSKTMLREDVTVYLICEERRDDGSRFAGYGELTSEELKAMESRRRRVTPSMVDDACRCWCAFTSSSPKAWLAITTEPHELTPFMADAAGRLLEQLPDTRGLNRLEAEILMALAGGCTRLIPLFSKVSDMESRPFFGDTVIWQALNRMATASTPLVELRGPAALLPTNVLPPADTPPFQPEDWRVIMTLEGLRALWGFGSAKGTWDRERWVANVRLSPETPLWFDREKRQLYC